MPAVPFQARHQSASGEPQVLIYVPVYYTLDEAATALAQTRPTLPARFGRRTAQVGLGEAAAAGYTGRNARGVDPAAVQAYRDQLIEQRIFPRPAGEEVD